MRDAMPDRIPDEVLARHLHDARRTVRAYRSRRRRMARAARHAWESLRDRDVLFVTALVFLKVLAVTSSIAALALAVVVWPWLGLYVLLPTVVLFAVSFALAMRVTRRDRDAARPL